MVYPVNSWITDTVGHGDSSSWVSNPASVTQDNLLALRSPPVDIRMGGDTITFWTKYELGAGNVGLVEYRYPPDVFKSCQTLDSQQIPRTIKGTEKIGSLSTARCLLG